ncbi:unnamed protein product [Amoebophrya sp. A25]|nr:unnamed protein product [Amoebophrya sp. A25]|eukprot:GSA25T00012182001.1
MALRDATQVVPEPKLLDDLLSKTKYCDPDPEVGQAFWVGCPKMPIQRNINLFSLKNGADLEQSDIVYCCGACVWLEPPYHGTCRMPVTKKPPTDYGEKQTDQDVFWVTYMDYTYVDPMKRYCLVKVGDELMYFRVWLAHKFGKMFNGYDNAADTTWWYKFYMYLDTDKSNSVDMEEFQVGLTKLGYPVARNVHAEENNNRRGRLLQLLDTDGSGDLSFEEFADVLEINPKAVLEKVSEFKMDKKWDDLQDRIKKARFKDEESYVNGRYSMRQAYDNMLRFRNEKRRFKKNTESQRSLDKLYPDSNKAAKNRAKSADAAASKATKKGKLPDMYTQHPTMWSCRQGIAGRDLKHVHPNFREYFDSPGTMTSDKEIKEQLERDMYPPAPRIAMKDELRMMREHLLEEFSADSFENKDVMQRIFAKLDANGNGSVSKEEMVQGLRELHYPKGPTTITTRRRRERIFHHMDADASGDLEIEEIGAIMRGVGPRALVDESTDLAIAGSARGLHKLKNTQSGPGVKLPPISR